MTGHPRDTGNDPGVVFDSSRGNSSGEQHSEPERSTHETLEPVSEEDYWSQFPDTLTTADVAKIIRTGAPAVRARLRDGTIPGHRIADSWIIFKSEIRAWLAATSKRPRTSEPVDVLADYPD